MTTLAEAHASWQIEFGDIIMYPIFQLGDNGDLGQSRPVIYLGADNRDRWRGYQREGAYYVAELTDISKVYSTYGWYDIKLLSRVRDAVG